MAASGANVGLSYVVESTHGETPSSPSMQTLRSTGRNVNLTKATLQSSEVRSDRQQQDVRHGFNQVSGSIPFELSVQSYDDMLEGALSGTWATAPDTGATTLSAAAATSEFTRGTGSFLTDGFEPGDVVDSSGFTNGANNGRFRVISVTATELEVDGSLVDETGGGDEQIQAPGQRLKIGSTLRTFTFERRFTDISQYQVFRGVTINQMSLSVQPENIVTGSLELLGMSAAAMSGTSLGSPSAAPTNAPLSAFEGTLYEGGSEIAVVTGIDMQLANNRQLQPIVGQTTSPDVYEGTCAITGTLTAFFEDTSLINKFVNETESSLYLRLDDLNGTDFLNIVLPRIKYTGGEMDPPQEGPVTISMPFTALVDSTTSTTMAIQRSNS